MIFTIGYIKSDKALIVKNFDLTCETFPKTLSLDCIKEERIDLLLAKDLENESEILSILEEENKYHPIADAKNFDINEEGFNNLSYHQAKEIIKKSYSTWTLDNNLRSLENIFQTVDNLKELWPNDRMDFFEELWFILKKNLGSSTLKLIFNNIKINEKTHQKNQLVQFRIEGIRTPEPHVGDDFEKSLMESYSVQLENTFDITEYDKNQGQLVICASIKESPVIIMAELFDLTGVQKSLIHALFEGLQSI